MRTTIDLDDSLLRRLRKAAHEQGVSFRALLRRVIRRGLGDRARGDEGPYVMPSRRLGSVRQGVDLVKALSLADALEDETRVSRLATDR
jgi:hypothetical protein